MDVSWWSSVDNFERIFWIIAIPATVAMVIQLVMIFIGGDVEGDVDAELEIDDQLEADHGIPFQFFTLKNLIAFFTIFGWTGIACIEAGLSNLLVIIISFIAGLLMMLIMATLFYYMGKLVQSGSLNLKNALHCEGEVYLPVPKKRGGYGKIQIKVQGALRELDAITNDQKDIPTGSIVKVVEVSTNNILVVTKN